ncbi:MAG: GNAT family N-acetyltransferase [Actinobacteria bacterium]|nr:GNAT family N-acetyltransferase [Actinomycetota bacterium]
MAATTSLIEISRATDADAGEILSLQRLAWEGEAHLYQDPEIPPLTESLEELRDDIGTMAFLKATADGVIIGSVRARQEGDTCHIGRLMVHPDCRRRGLGSRLVSEIESHFPGAARFALFTGQRSSDNIRLYESHGYVVVSEERVSDRVTLILMEKRLR